MTLELTKLGFPEGIRPRRLSISELARCLVVSGTTAGEPAHRRRIYVRGFDEPQYQEIAWPTGCNAFSAPVISTSRRVFFAEGLLWEDGGGGWSLGLYEVHLVDRTTRRIDAAQHLCKRDMTAPEARERPWLSGLLGPAADGHRLLVKIAQGNTVGDMTEYTYSVCLLDPSTGGLERVADLPAGVA